MRLGIDGYAMLRPFWEHPWMISVQLCQANSQVSLVDPFGIVIMVGEVVGAVRQGFWYTCKSNREKSQSEWETIWFWCTLFSKKPIILVLVSDLYAVAAPYLS